MDYDILHSICGENMCRLAQFPAVRVSFDIISAFSIFFLSAYRRNEDLFKRKMLFYLHHKCWFYRANRKKMKQMIGIEVDLATFNPFYWNVLSVRRWCKHQEDSRHQDCGWNSIFRWIFRWLYLAAASYRFIWTAVLCLKSSQTFSIPMRSAWNHRVKCKVNGMQCIHRGDEI